MNPSKLTVAFLKFLSAVKQNNNAAISQAAAEVQAEYLSQATPNDAADAAIRKIIERADDENAFTFLAQIVL